MEHKGKRMKPGKGHKSGSGRKQFRKSDSGKMESKFHPITQKSEEGVPFSNKKPPGSKKGAYSKSKSSPWKGKNADTRDAPAFDAPIRLNRYLANAGVCSRREADKLIQSGSVSVNGKVVTELGTKVRPNDKVQFGGETLSREKPRYILLNKPKDFITTSSDPHNRRTVMSLVENACRERIYPVGRLDRNTTGLLLFTNDGEMAKKLMHPKFQTKKIYHVYLDKNLTKNDLIKIAGGLELEDGFTQPDSLAYVADVNDKKQVGIELHSGKNRIVRRIFEHLGYQVVKLDRVFYAGLTKKDLPRGKWRFLNPKEVNLLKRI